MEISQVDIFKYVLFNDELDPDEKEYIRANEKLFFEQIEMCKSYLELSDDIEIKNMAKQAAERIII